MCQLLETIKCKDGKLYNLEFHQARFDDARKNYFHCDDNITLANAILVPDEFKSGLFRCRVLYSSKIEKVEFLRHQYRKVERLKLVEDNAIDYKFKYSDREKLDKLFEKRGNCDDILIVKKGFITDSYTANPVFFDGQEWWTTDSPLLAGTQRARLISERKLKVCSIAKNDLTKFTKVGLINALQDMEEMPIIDIRNVNK